MIIRWTWRNACLLFLPASFGSRSRFLFIPPVLPSAQKDIRHSDKRSQKTNKDDFWKM